MKIKEHEIVNAIHKFVDECDADELARLAGDLFGGNCCWDEMNCLDTDLQEEDTYIFEPNGNYYGEFGEQDDID